MITRIDPQTQNKLALITKACRERGVDPVPVLDRAGYICHPAKRAQLREQVLREVIDVINAASPTMLGGGIVPATAADMKRCILETIERMIS